MISLICRRSFLILAPLNFDWPIWIASLSIVCVSCLMYVFLAWCLSVGLCQLMSDCACPFTIFLSISCLVSVFVICVCFLCFCVSEYRAIAFKCDTGPWIRTTHNGLLFLVLCWGILQAPVRITWTNRHGRRPGTRTGRCYLSWKQKKTPKQNPVFMWFS